MQVQQGHVDRDVSHEVPLPPEVQDTGYYRGCMAEKD